MQEILLASLEQGLIFSLLAVGVMITFRLLDIADLSVEGTFPLGAFVLAWGFASNLNPFLGLVLAFVAGSLAGLFTYFLYKKLAIPAILAGILTMTILYTVNLKINGTSNVPLATETTLFDLSQALPDVLILGVIVLVMKLALDWFLQTEQGYLLKVTGDNDSLVRSLGQNPNRYLALGLLLSNGLAALSGALMAQYQGFVDITMGQSMIVTALASIVIGEAIFRYNKSLKITSRGILGALIYRIIYGLAIHFGLNPDDLKAITALIVIAFIAYNNLSASQKRRQQIRKAKEQ
ncbi:MAG: ABC transporter permease [Tissierellia bacterium]|nr:ABC transporter permease [Tissierellia bacterium]